MPQKRSDNVTDGTCSNYGNVKCIFQLNIQGLRNKHTVLESFLLQHSCKFVAVCLSEHWLRECEMTHYDVAKYRLGASFSRSERIHGGVAVLVREDVRYVPIDLSAFSVEIEAELAAVKLPDEHVVIVSIYRSPSGCLQTFMSVLARVFEVLSVGSFNVILVGDFNVHFQNPGDADTSELCGFLREYGLMSNFCSPTRFGNCLDNAFANTLIPIQSRTVNFVFSDHMGVETDYCSQSSGATHLENRIIRPTTERGLQLFFRLVQEIDFRWVGSGEVDVERAAGFLVETLSGLAFEAFPSRVVTCGGRNPLQIAWFTPRLRELRDQLHNLIDLYHATKSIDVRQRVAQSRGVYKRAILEAKRQANEKYIQEHSSSSRAVWRVIRSNNSTQAMPKCSSALTADRFNSFFLDVPQRVISALPPASCDPLSLSPWLDTGESRGTYFEFELVSQIQMRSAIQSLKNSKSPDYFGLNSLMIKRITDLIIGPLTRLFNKCIRESIFPSVLKIASVIPIHKSGDIDDINNYRPISIIPVIGKVFERLLSDQLVNFLETKNLFSPNQHGFRAGKSTGTAVAALVNRIVGHFERREYCEVTFLDLSKAFDCVSHELLIRKLYMYNLHPCACRMLSSYLLNRKQCTRYNLSLSDVGELSAGVVQGSIIGPLMFLPFVNDFPSGFPTRETLLYADDTTIFSAGASNDCAMRARALKMGVVKEWFAANRLALNNGKTVNLTFTLLRNPDARRASKFLGLYVDTELTWNSHCNALVQRLSSGCFALRRLSESVSPHVLKVAYFSLFQSHLSYGILVWGHSASAQRVFAVQRRAIRVLDGLGYQDDCRNSFVVRGILTLPSIYIYECLKYIRQHRDNLTYQGMIHNHNTRTRTNIRPDSLRLSRSRNGTNYYGIKFYNAISLEVRGLQDAAFLRSIKRFLLEGAFYTTDEFLQRAP